jgi:hypothetical protein
LFLAKQVIDALGEEAAADALFAALSATRMRVPPTRIQDVLALIGPDRACDCPSLPANVRNISSNARHGLDSGRAQSLCVEPINGG